MIVIDGRRVNDLLDFPGLIDALAEAFRAPPVQPVRHAHMIKHHGGSDNSLLLMPAWQEPGKGPAFMGVKIVAVAPDNGAKGLGAVQASYLLFDAETGVAKAMIYGHSLTLWRTAAASALATRHLARADARHLTMIGSGGLAPFLVRAHASIRPIETVTVWNRNHAKAVELAQHLSEAGFAASATENLSAAVQQADIVSAATLSTEPLIRLADVKPGTHVDLVGAFTPSMRETDSALIGAARVYADTRAGALKEAGDLVLAQADGLFDPSRLCGDLTELERGTCAGRGSPDEITVFKSVGAALEDLAGAMLVLARHSS